MYGIIYVITNVVNGKQYVGQTTQSLKNRWDSHLASVEIGCVYAIHLAIRKYGVESFAIEHIDAAESQGELNEREIHHVARLGTYGGGYNLTPGGDHFEHAKETRCKISEANRGRTHSGKTRSKISESLLGHGVSEKTRQKLSEANRPSCCRRGHEYDEANTYVDRRTKHRTCLVCRHLRMNRKLPEHLQKYVTGREVYSERKNAQV